MDRQVNVLTLLAAMALAAMALAAPAAGAERLSDPQVAQLVESIDRGFDRWKDDLERRNLDDAVIRSAAGTVNVRTFLQSFERDIDAVKDRLKPHYAAGPEVTALLRRSSDVEKRYRSSPAPEAWHTLSGHLSSLAAAYSASWPDGTIVAERKTDAEVAAEARRLSDSVDRMRDGVSRAARDAKRSQMEREAAERDMRELKDAARRLEAGLKDHRAVASDAARVLELADKALTYAGAVGRLRTEATAAVNAISTTRNNIAVAFGMGGTR